MKLKFILVTLLPVTVLFAMSFEFIFRFIPTPYFRDSPWVFDPRLGWTNIKSVEQNVEVLGRKLILEFNSKGHRDLEWNFTFLPTEKRIVFIGDSFLEALQVNRNETFWALLETKLQKLHPEFQWKVINLGVGDYGNYQAYLTLMQEAKFLQPDLVIFEFFPLNDVWNNEITASGLSSPQDKFRPYLNPENPENPQFQSNLAARLRTHSKFFHWMDALKDKFTFPPGESGKPPKQIAWEHRVKKVATQNKMGIAGEEFSSLLMNVFSPSETQIPIVQQGWKTTEKIFALIEKYCAENSLPLMNVILPHRGQLKDRVPAYQRQVNYPLDTFLGEKMAMKFFAKKNVKVIPMIETFNQNLEIVVPGIDGHLNVAAHEVVADQLVVPSEELLGLIK